MSKNNRSKSIKEVADILGCSVQAVYNRLEKDFKPYLKIENGKKRLDIGVLEYLNKDEDSSNFKTFFKANLNLLEKQNEQLSKELDIKNEQIKELNNRLKESHETINNLQQNIGAEQALHAGTIQNQLSDGKEKKSWQFWKK